MIRSGFLWFKHLTYAVVLLALVACLAEVALRVYDSATGQITRRDLYDRGMVCKSWFVHHTLKPSHAFAVKNPDSGARVRVAVNSLGLRGKEAAIPKPGGIFRVLCLGDDTTFAAATPEPETFCALLAEALPERLGRPVEVINAGVPDYCPLLSYLQFRHELLALQPDLVILNFDMSDVADDYQLRRYTVMDSVGLPVNCANPSLELVRGGKPGKEGMLLLPQFAKQRLSRLLADRMLNETSRSIDSPRCRYLWLEDKAPDWSIHINLALEPIANLHDLASATGVKLMVAACPAPWQVSSTASSGEGVREQAGVGPDALLRSRRPFEMLAEFCQARQIPFCDVSTAFVEDSQPERLYLTNAAVFSAEGHELYARLLAGFLAQRLPAAAPASPDFTSPQPQARLTPK